MLRRSDRRQSWPATQRDYAGFLGGGVEKGHSKAPIEAFSMPVRGVLRSKTGQLRDDPLQGWHVSADFVQDRSEDRVIAFMCGGQQGKSAALVGGCLLYTSPSPRDRTSSR